MSAPLSDLSLPVQRPVLDLLSAFGVVLVTGIINALPTIAQILGVVVLLLTVWEKPTVQALVLRLRTSFSRRDDDALGR
ncbi:hypothetical protein [Novosphingobium rosa]|uniref:hypothetical protein n=1 Tax=Novosphingobium rosa TaxID=76978 RepID=UPI00082D1573|nr:hypothetical protein [Novosphingobium rosa]